MPVSITVKIEPEVNERVHRWLSRSGETMSDFVRAAIEEKLSRNPATKSPYELARDIGLIGAYGGSPIAPHRTGRKQRVKEAVRGKYRR